MNILELKKTFKKQISSLKKIYNYLNKFEILSKKTIVNAFEMEDVLLKIEKSQRELESSISDELKNWVEVEKKFIERAKEEAKFDFAKKLQILLKKEGKKLEGRYPNLRIGPFGLEVNFTRKKVTLLFGYEKIFTNIPLNAEKVVRTIEDYEKELMKPIDFQREIDLLFEAYKRVCKLRDFSLGKRVPIMEVLQQYLILKQSKAFLSNPIRRNFKEYGRAKFGYDLYRIRKSGVKARGKLRMSLVTATFDATRKKEDFIWVPDNMKGDGTTFSYIFFREG